MGPKKRGARRVVCKRVVIVWDMECKLGKEGCMAMMDVMDTGKAVGSEDWRSVRSKSSWSVGITVGE